MICKNNTYKDYDWICLCCPKDKNIRDYVKSLFNNWVINLINDLKSKVDNLSDKEILNQLIKIEDEANNCYNQWKNTL